MKKINLKSVRSFFKSFLYLNKNEKIIRKCYLKALEREPEKLGLKHFLVLMRSAFKPNGIDEKKLMSILESSDEGKKIKLAKSNDGRDQYVFIGKYDVKYYIRPNSALDATVVKNSILNKWLCSKLNLLVKKDATIFDVGANAGLLSLPLAKKCILNGKLYAFEPDSQVLKQLKRNVKLNKQNNISIEKIALQDDPKIDSLALNINRAVQDNGLRNDGLSTIIERNNLYRIKKESVVSSTIDKFVLKNNISNLEFIKIDTEGADHRVLKGGQDAIRKFLPIIFYEYSPSLNKQINSNNSKKSFNLIEKLGYVQYYLDTSKDKTKLVLMKSYINDFQDGDILCFHKSKQSEYMKKII